MLFEQFRLNRWDLWTAGAIAREVSNLGISPGTRIWIVGANRGVRERAGIEIDQVPLSTTNGDLNVSALANSWAAGPLFSETTGRFWNIAVASSKPEVCDPKIIWPTKESIKIVEGEVFVCMGSGP